MSWTPHRSIDDTLAFLRRIVSDNAEGRSCGFLIFSRESGELLGSVGGAIDEAPHAIRLLPGSRRLGQGICHRGRTGVCQRGARTFLRSGGSKRTATSRIRVGPRARKSRADARRNAARYMVMPNLGEKPRDVIATPRFERINASFRRSAANLTRLARGRGRMMPVRAVQCLRR